MAIRKGLVCIAASIASFSAGAQYGDTQRKAVILKRMIQLNHFQPRAVDDSLSSEMFRKCINELDPHRNLFTASDYALLAAYRYKLDDELNGVGWSFLDLATKNYRRVLQRADSIINVVLAKPLDFSSDDRITISAEEEPPFEFPSSAAELANRWVRRLKYLLLRDIYDRGALDSARSSLRTILPKYEAAVRQKLKKVQTGNIERILDPVDFENYVAEIYLNAFATSFDPHTMYFSPHERENFQASISTEQYSLGLTIDDNSEGKVVIDRLIPGGPAWKSGELNKDDEIEQLQWEGKEPVDVSVLTAEEATDILNESNHGKITIKVRKANGTTRTVMLRKEKIQTDEDVVRGYLLKGKHKIGYITLPDFYTSWEDENGSGCANDVAKEIVKLKKENMDGLILDLRFNGGGSVNEALQMIGIFIDEGPLAGAKGRDQKLSFLKDPNRGTIYDGPLLLLVNSQSASASEMLAAALQDYNRAVITGSPTYGKATMQKFFALDTESNNNSPVFRNDVVKITEGKLYRVTGQSAQLKGVIPDIILPDVFDGLKYREKFSSDVLPSDTVKKNSYYRPLPALPINELSQLSAQRIRSNKNFENIAAAIESEHQVLEKKTVILKPEPFEQWLRQAESLRGLEESHEGDRSDVFIAQDYSAPGRQNQGGIYATRVDDAILKNLQRDIYIEEAFNIISDLVNSNK